MATVLAVDVGSSSARAQIFGASGQPDGELAQERYEGERDAGRLAEIARRAIDTALGDRRVDAVGVACFGHSLLALDSDEEPLTPILDWRDNRSAPNARELTARLDGEEVHTRTGSFLHPGFWPAKLAWLADTDSETFRSARRFVSFAEYLYGRILRTSTAPVSLSLASGTGLLNLQARAWDEELLAALGLDPERLSPISDEPLGDWYPALLDGACSNVGAGCVTRERAALMIGTSGALRTVSDRPLPQPRPGLFLYRVDERRVVEGGALSDGGNLRRWLANTLRDADGSLAGRDPDSHGLTFLTLLGGERSPGWHQDAKGAIHGLTFATTPLDLRQAALEGVAFRFAEIADLMPEVTEIVATGRALYGNTDWLQIIADALARPIAASTIAEASLRGAAILTLERLGLTPDDAALGRVFVPREEHAEAYRSARERQRRLSEEVT